MYVGQLASTLYYDGRRLTKPTAFASALKSDIENKMSELSVELDKKIGVQQKKIEDVSLKANIFDKKFSAVVEIENEEILMSYSLDVTVPEIFRGFCFTHKYLFYDRV